MANAVPEVLDATSARSKATELVKVERHKSSIPPTLQECKLLFDSSIPHILVSLPCLSREEKRQARFEADFTAARQLASSYVPCTGVGIGKPKGKDVCMLESAPLVVELVEEGSPAQSAGVRIGDVILQVNSKKITYWRDIELEEARAVIGSEMQLTLKRNGNFVNSKLNVGRRSYDLGSSNACAAK